MHGYHKKQFLSKFSYGGNMNRYIFVNLKRFDISTAHAGVNRLSPIQKWASTIVSLLEKGLAQVDNLPKDMAFPLFFPEAHLIAASQAKNPKASNPVEIGCQSVHTHDTQSGKNFGAFTTSLTANAAVELGCAWTLIGHSEQRAKLAAMYQLAGCDGSQAIHEILNQQVKQAIAAGLKVLFCIGEKADEVSRTEEVLSEQLQQGLKDIDPSRIVLAYEPIWAIGPGKTPPSAEKIREIAVLVKKLYAAPLVYGGGLKKENAASIGAIAELDGGLIALTRFSGEIGFYPDEYLEIVRTYCEGVNNL